jgi:hypothetical protein
MRTLISLLSGALALGMADVAVGQEKRELRFEVPSGYVEQRSGELVVLIPRTVDERTPCVYGIAPARPSSGDLDADAERALLEVVVAGWRRLDDRHAAMRGVSAAGWSYSWYRAAFEGDVGGQRQAINAMAMVLPADSGAVHVVWGMGSIARCLLDDATFEQLFQSLAPSGWTSDGGAALARALVGTWRHTASVGLQQIRFANGGRYERGIGTSARVGVAERTSSTATSGRFELENGELALVPDHRPRDVERRRVRVYDEWFAGQWKRAMAILDPTANPPIVVTYYIVDP